MSDTHSLQKDCVICTEELTDIDLVTTVCGHKFHFTCLNKWQYRLGAREDRLGARSGELCEYEQSSCPLCRAKLISFNREQKIPKVKEYGYNKISRAPERILKACYNFWKSKSDAMWESGRRH